MRSALAALLLFPSPALAWDSGANCGPHAFDTLGWMTAQPGYATVHGAGTRHNRYTVIQKSPNCFDCGMIFNVNDPQGFPWDLNIYNHSFVYFWITAAIPELAWKDPTEFSKFTENARTFETDNIMAPRCAPFGFPGWTGPYKVAQLTLSPGGGCNAKRSYSIWPNQSQVWGPYHMTFGGNVPPNSDTMVVAYYWGLGNSGWRVQERQYFVEGFGLVRWESWQLQDDLSYKLADQTTFNLLMPGKLPRYQFPCQP